MSEDESFLVKPSDVGEMIRTGDKDALVNLYERPLSVIAASVAGWLASGPKEWILATGRIVQGALKAKFFQQVSAELKNLEQKGKLAENWADKPKGYQTWSELLRVIDEETPDEEKLDALKAMFFAVNRINASDADRIFTYQLFQIAKKLNSNELLMLKAVYGLFKKGRGHVVNNEASWLQEVTGLVGHSSQELVLLAKIGLKENQLLRDIDVNNHIRCGLTNLGVKFCENLQQHEIDKKS